MLVTIHYRTLNVFGAIARSLPIRMLLDKYTIADRFAVANTAAMHEFVSGYDPERAVQSRSLQPADSRETFGKRPDDLQRLRPDLICSTARALGGSWRETTHLQPGCAFLKERI